MAPADGRLAARWCSAVGAGSLLALIVMMPAYFRPCGRLTPGEEVQLVAFIMTCATAFLACPRSRVHHKALTLVCYVLSAVLVTGSGTRDFADLLSDQATVHLAHAYQGLGVWPASPAPSRCGA